MAAQTVLRQRRPPPVIPAQAGIQQPHPSLRRRNVIPVPRAGAGRQTLHPSFRRRNLSAARDRCGRGGPTRHSGRRHPSFRRRNVTPYSDTGPESRPHPSFRRRNVTPYSDTGPASTVSLISPWPDGILPPGCPSSLIPVQAAIHTQPFNRLVRCWLANHLIDWSGAGWQTRLRYHGKMPARQPFNKLVRCWLADPFALSWQDACKTSI